MGYTHDEFPRETVLTWHRMLGDAGFEVELDPLLIDAADLPPEVTPIECRKGSVTRDGEEVTLIPGFTRHRGLEEDFYIYHLGYFLDSPILSIGKRRSRLIAQHSLVEDIIATLNQADMQQSES